MKKLINVRSVALTLLVLAAFAATNALAQYTVTINPGWNLIANPLVNPGGDTINNLLSSVSVPLGSQLDEWDSANQRFLGSTYSSYKGVIAWRGDIDGTATLDPGQGAWFYDPSSSFQITFSGAYATPVPVTLSAGWYLLSAQTPNGNDYDNIMGQPAGTLPALGTSVDAWDPVSEAFIGASYVSLKGQSQWDPSWPTIPVGQSVWINGGAGAGGPPVVPEPSAGLLAVLGLALLAGVERLRRKLSK